MRNHHENVTRYIDLGVIFLNYADLLFQTIIFTADDNI